MRRLTRVLVSVLVLVVLAGAVVTLVRASDGDFSGSYKLSGLFDQAGEGLPPGSEVVFRGVQVGRVSSAVLQGDKAKVTVLIDPTFKVPARAVATIQPINLFGADEVALTTPGQGQGQGQGQAQGQGQGQGQRGPYLAPGGHFAKTENADELGDLFAAATPLLQKINTDNLSTVLGELGQASQGEGPSIARSIGAGTKLARDLDSSLNAQEVALNSFARFVQATAPLAGNLNGVSGGVNAALPAFNSEEADYQKFLNAVIPFANDLSSLLVNYRPDIDTILSAGDNVSRVLVAQQSNIGQLIQGAYSYFHTIATGAASRQKLPDGSTYAYFNTFILFSDVNNLVCGLLAPATPGLSFLQPLQQALAGAGSAFNCSTQLAAFNAAQGTAASTATTPSAGSAAASTNSAAQSVTNQVYGIVGAPNPNPSASPSPGASTSQGSGLGGFISGLLGAGPGPGPGAGPGGGGGL